jgi:hypothetical protein
VITGNAGNNSLTGGSGADTFVGGLGADTMSGAGGNDLVDYSAMAGVSINLALNTAGGDAAGDSFSAIEYLLGSSSGANSLVGDIGSNSLTGGAAADTLEGGGSNDTLVGLGGDDIYVVDALGDVVTESALSGTDTVRTGLASYTLGSNLENLTYTGGSNFTGLIHGSNA